MTPPRIVLFGYSDVGHACLTELMRRGANVAAVYTHADAPDEAAWFPSVARLAADHGIPVRMDADFSSARELEALRSLAPDLVLSCYYRRLLPAAVLALPRLGAYNVHGSLLPRYRGRAPVNWAVLHGERESGATLHVMTPRADAGDIVDQEAVRIGPDDTAADVQARVCDAAVTVLARQLDALLEGRARRRPQDQSLASTFGRRRPSDGAFAWDRASTDIHNLVRAVSHPYPGAFTTTARGTLYVWRTRLTGRRAAGARPGDMQLLDDRLYVACGDDWWLEILRAQLDGDTERDGADLAHRLGVPVPLPIPHGS